jgi:hypothetical protein
MKYLKSLSVYQVEENKTLQKLYFSEKIQMKDLIGKNFEVQMNSGGIYYVINCTQDDIDELEIGFIIKFISHK